MSNDSCGDLDVEAGMTVSGSVDGDGSIRNDLEIADDLEAYADSENAGTDAKDTSEEEEISTQTQKMMIDRLSSVHHNEIILPKKQSSFSNVCAICLDAYKTGDTVVWSNNSECQHVFHTECILDYLVHHKEESKAPCPCCRRQFLTKAQKKSRNSSMHSC